MNVPWPELDRLVEIGVLEREPPAKAEINGLIRSAHDRIVDASIPGLSLAGRFDLLYNAAHALALAALRSVGFRPRGQRYVVFQVLEHTLGITQGTQRFLVHCHRVRNEMEYEGYSDPDETLVNGLASAANELETATRQRDD